MGTCCACMLINANVRCRCSLPTPFCYKSVVRVFAAGHHIYTDTPRAESEPRAPHILRFRIITCMHFVMSSINHSNWDELANFKTPPRVGATVRLNMSEFRDPAEACLPEVCKHCGCDKWHLITTFNPNEDSRWDYVGQQAQKVRRHVRGCSISMPKRNAQLLSRAWPSPLQASQRLLTSWIVRRMRISTPRVRWMRCLRTSSPQMTICSLVSLGCYAVHPFSSDASTQSLPPRSQLNGRISSASV